MNWKVFLQALSAFTQGALARRAGDVALDEHRLCPVGRLAEFREFDSELRDLHFLGRTRRGVAAELAGRVEQLHLRLSLFPGSRRHFLALLTVELGQLVQLLLMELAQGVLHDRPHRRCLVVGGAARLEQPI